MRLTARFVGEKKTKRILRRYHRAVTRETGDLIQRAEKNATRFAKRKVPVVTGELKRSIRGKVDLGRELSYTVTADAPHAVFAEFQKRGAGGQPRPEDRRLWLTRTFKRSHQFLRRKLRVVVANVNAKVARR